MYATHFTTHMHTLAGLRLPVSSLLQNKLEDTMAPLILVAVMASLSVAAAAGGEMENGLRGGRILKTSYCNSIECPDSYTPIDDAMNVACEGDECSVSQCCEAFCSYYACDDGYTQISNANTTMCADSGCTAGLCCEAFCSYYPCKNNFVPVEDADTILCEDTGCTRSLCCEYGIEKFKPVCNSIECPDNYTPIDDAANVLCDGGVCEVSQCCEAYCSYYACPNGYTPVEDADLILCPTTGSGCTKSLCCDGP
eukprot:jgi/Undpi1/12952/HiC_scaffold_7.g02618.m1